MHSRLLWPCPGLPSGPSAPPFPVAPLLCPPGDPCSKSCILPSATSPSPPGGRSAPLQGARCLGDGVIRAPSPAHPRWAPALTLPSAGLRPPRLGLAPLVWTLAPLVGRGSALIPPALRCSPACLSLPRAFKAEEPGSLSCFCLWPVGPGTSWRSGERGSGVCTHGALHGSTPGRSLFPCIKCPALLSAHLSLTALLELVQGHLHQEACCDHCLLPGGSRSPLSSRQHFRGQGWCPLWSVGHEVPGAVMLCGRRGHCWEGKRSWEPREGILD